MADSRDVTDFYLLDEKLTDEERGIRDRLRAFCEAEITPVINGYWERAEFPFELVPKIAELQLAGGTVDGYGCPGMSATAAGLVSMEWARADGSIGTFFGVHSNLAMQAIAMLGSEEHKQRWLPPMADLDAVGAFALTEPEHGSDAVRLETSARRDGDAYVLDGRKRWIGNATIADVVIVWARDEDGHVGGFLALDQCCLGQVVAILGQGQFGLFCPARLQFLETDEGPLHFLAVGDRARRRTAPRRRLVLDRALV